uniref:(northern house mosquito) hypothetical protein n=1 Tax=Culex pipiens TaxID=7175 RepID=A0A8D8NN28_CULPI
MCLFREPTHCFLPLLFQKGKCSVSSRIRKGVDVVVAVAVNAPFRVRSSSALVSFCFFLLISITTMRFQIFFLFLVVFFLCLLACDYRFFLLLFVFRSFSLACVLFSVTIIIN